MASSDIRAGRAFIEIYTKDSMARGLAMAQMKLRAFAAGVTAIGLPMQAIGATIAALLGGTAAVFGRSGSAVYEMAQRTGMGAEAVSELGYAARQTETDVAALETGIKWMQRTIAQAEDGSDSAQAKLDELGVTLADLRGLTPDKQFEVFASAIASLADPAQRVDSAMDIFGRGAAALIPLLAQGASGIQTLRDECRELGLVITDDMAKRADNLMDAFGRLVSMVKMTAVSVGSALEPIFASMADVLPKLLKPVNDFIQANGQIVRTVFIAAGIVMGMGTALVGLGVVASIGAFALGGLAAAGSLVAATLGVIMSPMALTIAGVVALGGAILHWTGAGGTAVSWLSARFRELGSFVGGVMQSMSDAIMGGDLALASEILFASLKLVWQQGATALLNIWNDVLDSMAKGTVNAIAGLQTVMASLEHSVTNPKGWGDLINLGLSIGAFQLGISDGADMSPAAAAAFQSNAGTPFASEMQRIQEQRRKDLAALEEERKRNQQAAEDELQQARDRLKAAQDRAAADKFMGQWIDQWAMLDPFAGSPAQPGAGAGDVSNELANRVADEVMHFESRGTFAANAIQSLEGTTFTRLQERAAKAAEKMVEKQDETIDAIEGIEGGIAFA
jgi:hypothetical protein